jgi:pimeloyl-ACP methyl ester carboxylesterase
MSEPLHYVEVGTGPPLLLVHGDFLDGPTTWAAQMETLADQHRMIVVDRRGRGQSPTEPRPYTIAGDAADLLALADSLDVARFHLCGQSYGAVVAIEVARRAPERLLSLHLIEPPYIQLLDDAAERARMEVAGEIFARSRERGAEQTVTDFVTMLAGPGAAERLRTRPVWQVMLRESAALADVESPSQYPASAVDDLGLDVPIRVYRGGRSNPGMRRIAERLAERLDGARLVDVPDAPHDVQRIHAPFNAALLEATGG